MNDSFPISALFAALIPWVVIAVIAFAFLRVARRKRQIMNPRLGILDLTDGTSEGIIEEDKAALRDLFTSLEESTNVVPKCDVLFLYATLSEGGTLQKTDRDLRITIRDSGAKIVVVATENTNPKPSKDKPTYGRANLVITGSRNGASFPRFFRELFTRMKKGQSMPMAWVRIAPQGPNSKHSDCPSTICLMEAGAVSFR